MGTKIDYETFLKDFDKKLLSYFKEHKSHICCKPACSACCEIGDYPISELELKYLMQGYIKLDSESKILVQNNIKTMIKGGACPFLINQLCSVYEYRPIICRVHGLAYICHDKTVKLPYCANSALNYANVYERGEFLSEPIKENLDTSNVLKEFDYGGIKNLYDWIFG